MLPGLLRQQGGFQPLKSSDGVCVGGSPECAIEELTDGLHITSLRARDQRRGDLGNVLLGDRVQQGVTQAFGLAACRIAGAARVSLSEATAPVSPVG